MGNLYRGPSIDASYQVSDHQAKRFQRRRFFRNRPIRNNNCLWQPCLSTDRDEMCILNRGTSIDAFYHVSVHLAHSFRGENFFKSTNQKQELSVAVMFVNGSKQNQQSLQRTWRPCLFTDRDEMSNLYRGPSIDAYYQVSVDLAKRFKGEN